MAAFMCILDNDDESRREGFRLKAGVGGDGHLSSLFGSEAA